MTRVLIVATDVVGERMAGPGVRAWEFARALAHSHEVTLAAAPPLPGGEDAFEVVEAARSSLARAAKAAEVLVLQPVALRLFPQLLESRAAKVVDLYDPAIIEGLELDAGEPAAERLTRHRADLETLTVAVGAGDFFLCASERQRHYWLGVLSALGRVNPLTYESDARLEHLLAVVPFGVPDEPPQRVGPGLRGAVEGIGEGDRVAVWAGGIWNWFDPQTLVRATRTAVAEIPNLRVVFMGTSHPNPAVPRMRAAAEAARLANELHLTGRHVFFQSGWTPYAQRAGVLLDAEVGIVLHRDTVESAFAFRTRVLDHLWAGLPSILTSGDSMSELAAEETFGLVVPPGDEEAVADALVRILTDDGLAHRLKQSALRTATRFRWSQVTVPLADFCSAPRQSPDRVAYTTPSANGWRGPGISSAWRSLRRQGLRQFAGRVYRYARRRFG